MALHLDIIGLKYLKEFFPFTFSNGRDSEERFCPVHAVMIDDVIWELFSAECYISALRGELALIRVDTVPRDSRATLPPPPTFSRRGSHGDSFISGKAFIIHGALTPMMHRRRP